MAVGREILEIQVFISGPGDVEEEKESGRKVIAELSDIFRELVEVQLKPIDGTRDVVPGMGRPQQVINEQTEPYDLYVGILWSRFGTPTGVAPSGTKEEFDRAYEALQKDELVDVAFFFSEKPADPESQEEFEELQQVREFKEEFQTGGEHEGLYFTFESLEDFEEKLRQTIIYHVGEVTETEDLTSAVQHRLFDRVADPMTLPPERVKATSTPIQELLSKSISRIQEIYRDSGRQVEERQGDIAIVCEEVTHRKLGYQLECGSEVLNECEIWTQREEGPSHHLLYSDRFRRKRLAEQRPGVPTFRYDESENKFEIQQENVPPRLFGTVSTDVVAGYLFELFTEPLDL